MACQKNIKSIENISLDVKNEKMHFLTRSWKFGVEVGIIFFALDVTLISIVFSLFYWFYLIFFVTQSMCVFKSYFMFQTYLADISNKMVN